MNPDLLFAVRQDWRIFPLLNHSSLATEQPLLHHATSEEGQIERWEQQYPECAWAVATGSESAVIALNFSLDEGSASIREFGERDFTLSSTLQLLGSNELFTFLEWSTVVLPPWTPGMIAPGVRLLEAGDYVRIPGPGISAHHQYEYLDREAPIRPPSAWLMNLIHGDSRMPPVARILAFRPSPDVARCVLLDFERRGELWFCDFYEASGTAKLRKTLSYHSSNKVMLLAIRGGAFTKQNERSRLCEGIEIGHGRIPLKLTPDQYEKLIAA
jgi:hypothetical protein